MVHQFAMDFMNIGLEMEFRFYELAVTCTINDTQTEHGVFSKAGGSGR